MTTVYIKTYSPIKSWNFFFSLLVSYLSLFPRSSVCFRDLNTLGSHTLCHPLYTPVAYGFPSLKTHIHVYITPLFYLMASCFPAWAFLFSLSLLQMQTLAFWSNYQEADVVHYFCTHHGQTFMPQRRTCTLFIRCISVATRPPATERQPNGRFTSTLACNEWLTTIVSHRSLWEKKISTRQTPPHKSSRTSRRNLVQEEHMK
ncbi:hypothetical protein L218DRAFT_344902 [Marasmius fiardii PR-910]|nr:hypothetical protein L218DRAFT_344902 [Marasmius fiardii PR-910]